MEDKPFIWQKFFVDAIYYIIILKIVSEMFTGIITDRFSNSREKLAEIKEDEDTNCFICGKSREEIEKDEENFIEHTNQDHSKLNYIFFIDFLRWKK